MQSYCNRFISCENIIKGTYTFDIDVDDSLIFNRCTKLLIKPKGNNEFPLVGNIVKSLYFQYYYNESLIIDDSVLWDFVPEQYNNGVYYYRCSINRPEMSGITGLKLIFQSEYNMDAHLFAEYMFIYNEHKLSCAKCNII